MLAASSTEQFVEFGQKVGAMLGCHGRGTPRDGAALAEFVHQVAHAEMFANVAVGERVALGGKDARVSGEAAGSKRNIGGDDNVARAALLGDPVVGRPETGLDN